MKQCNDRNAKEIFAKRLKELLHYNGLTQFRLAMDLGVTPQAISSYVLGKTTPDYSVLRDIARYFDVSIDFLLGR